MAIGQQDFRGDSIMKDIKFNIGCYVRAEHLQDISVYNKNYYKIDSRGDSCCTHYPYNII